MGCTVAAAGQAGRRGTLDRWRETLEDQGYLPRTINVRLAAANGLMTYLGHRELQATAALPAPGGGGAAGADPAGSICVCCPPPGFWRRSGSTCW